MDLDELIRRYNQDRIATEDPLRAEYFAGLIEGLEFCRNNAALSETKPKRSAYIGEFLKFITQQQKDYIYIAANSLIGMKKQNRIYCTNWNWILRQTRSFWTSRNTCRKTAGRGEGIKT